MINASVDTSSFSGTAQTQLLVRTPLREEPDTRSLPKHVRERQVCQFSEEGRMNSSVAERGDSESRRLDCSCRTRRHRDC